MKKAIKITLIVIACLFLIGFAAKKILLDSSFVAERPGITLGVDDFRALAGDAARLPVRINLLRVAQSDFPPGVVVAGNYSKTYSAPYIAYQIVYDKKLSGGGNTVIVDAVLDKTWLAKMGKEAAFDDAAYETLQKAMRKAEAIILTHEHFDHAAGIAHSPFFSEISSRVLLTPEQAAGTELRKAGFTPEMIAKCGKLDYSGAQALFPGVVLLKTPGHLKGHQVVYVKLRNGNEFLIAGDIAWNMDNITQLRSRPLLVSLILGEDRAASAGQIRWLHDAWHRGHPEVHIIVSHDRAQQDGYVKSGMMGEGFEL